MLLAIRINTRVEFIQFQQLAKCNSELLKLLNDGISCLVYYVHSMLIYKRIDTHFEVKLSVAGTRFRVILLFNLTVYELVRGVPKFPPQAIFLNK